MRFFINHIDDSSIPSDEKVLPILHMIVANDGRHDYHKFHEMIQNADITFSMVDVNTGQYRIANSPAFSEKVECGCCNDEYGIGYQFTKRQVSVPGVYNGYFTINFGDDLKNVSYSYPSGITKVPIREKLEIVVL